MLFLAGGALIPGNSRQHRHRVEGRLGPRRTAPGSLWRGTGSPACLQASYLVYMGSCGECDLPGQQLPPPSCRSFPLPFLLAFKSFLFPFFLPQTPAKAFAKS